MSMNPDPQRSDEVNLGTYLSSLRRQKWLIAVATLIGVALGLAYAQIKTPTYVATATVRIQAPEGATGSTTSEFTATEEIIAHSTAVAELVASDLGSSVDTETLLHHLSVKRGLGDASTISFSYSARSPLVAQEGADAFARAYETFKQQDAAQTYQALEDVAQAQILTLTRRIDHLNRKIAALPLNSGQRNSVRATVASLSDQISELRTKLAQALPLGQPASIIQSANLPTSPASPDPVAAAVAGFFIGLVTGIIIALIRRRRGERWRGAAELEEWFGAPVLAMIPKTSERREVVTIRDPRGAAAEGYRKLRAHLFLREGHPASTLMVTSASSGEDRSAVTTNLAVTLAQAGKRTILVSADFRRPGVDRLLQVHSAPGFSEVLSGESALSMALQPSGVHNLWVLSSGGSSNEDVDILHSDSIDEFLRTSVLVDYIIIDAAPLLAVADSLILAGLVEGVLMVADARDLRREDAIYAREELEQVGGRLLGIIVTQTPTGRATGGRGYETSRGPDQVPAGMAGRQPGGEGDNGKDADGQAWLQDKTPAAEQGNPAVSR